MSCVQIERGKKTQMPAQKLKELCHVKQLKDHRAYHTCCSAVRRSLD